MQTVTTKAGPRPSPHRRRWLLVVAVNLLVLACVVGAMELTSFLILRQKAGDCFVRDFRLNHVWKPNIRLEHHEWSKQEPAFARPYVEQFNRQGWPMENDITLAKPPGTYRIVYVGDSFVQGTAPMNQRMPFLVGEHLNSLARGSGLRVEVVNTGTFSYSPTLYYLLTREVLLQYRPDLIVVCVDMTDDFDDWKYGQTLVLDADGNPWAAPPRDVSRAGYVDTTRGTKKANMWNRAELFLFRYSWTYHLVVQSARDRLIDESPDPNPDAPNTKELYHRWSWCRKDWDATTQHQVDWTLTLLKKLAALCRANNVKLVITSVPHYWQYAGAADGTGKPAWSDRPHREIERTAVEAGVPYLNAFDRMNPNLQGAPQTNYYYHGDMHFNPRGYALWAETHVQYLVETAGLLPKAIQERGLTNGPAGTPTPSGTPGPR